MGLCAFTESRCKCLRLPEVPALFGSKFQDRRQCGRPDSGLLDWRWWRSRACGLFAPARGGKGTLVTRWHGFSPDVFVVGGGPAGLVCAIAAARAGFSVEVADAVQPSIDKACGEGLMPDGVEELRALGIDLAVVRKFAFRGIRFRQGLQTAQADFAGGSGYGIRRLELHALLVRRAVDAGVGLRWGCPVRSMVDGVVTTAQHTVRPRWIVGADGHSSLVRRWAGLDAGRISSRRVGLRQHFAIAPWSGYVEVYWGDGAQAYVTPVAEDEVGVAIVAKKKFASVEAAVDSFPMLRARLQGAMPASKARGAGTLQRRLARVTKGNVALVGDASGSVDAVTGEGLALGFRQAVAVVKAFGENDPGQYQKAHEGICALPHLVSKALLLMDGSRFARERAFNAFRAHPGLFDRMLQMHSSRRSPRLLGREGVFAMALTLLRA